MQRSTRASGHVPLGCIALLAFILHAFAGGLAGPAAAATYPKLIRINLDPDPGSASDLARYDHVAYSYRAPRSLRQSVRALNPSSIDFAWISSMGVSCVDYYGLTKAMRDSATAYNWWVYLADGSHATSWCADGINDEWVIDMSDECPRSPRGERFRDWLARTLVDSLVVGRGFHGLFLDECHSTIYWLRDFECNPRKILLDLNRDGIGDADSTVTRLWADGVYDFLRQLRQRVGRSYPILVNGAVNLYYDNNGKLLTDWVNGVMMECFLCMPPLYGNWWYNLYSFNRGYFPTQAAVQPYIGQKMMVIGDSGPCLGMSGSELERQKRLTLGGCLLGDGYYTRPPWITNEWQPEYDLCLGQPLAPADSMAGGNLGVWIREFTNGYVAVNPNSYPVAVPGKGLILPAKDAVIWQNPLPRVTDLQAAQVLDSIVQLRFTVPGGETGCGGPATYRLRALDPQGALREWSGNILGDPGFVQYVNAFILQAGTTYRFTVTVEKPESTPSAPSDTLRVTTGGGPDLLPPDQITRIIPTTVGFTAITLSWTAPSDPPQGKAAAYEMRWWNDGGSWMNGTEVPGLPVPAAPGTQQSVAVGDLAPNTRYFFQMRSRDAGNNWSIRSPEAWVATSQHSIAQAPPRPDMSLAVPNPFHRSTRLTLALPSDGMVDVSVFSSDGRRVCVLEHGPRAAGSFDLSWDGKDDAGTLVPNGVYICRFTVPSIELNRKLVFIRER